MLSLSGNMAQTYTAFRDDLMIEFMNMRTRMKISKGGQISIPAPIRHRWGTSTVALEDHGDRIVVAPAPDDPIAAAEGALATELRGLDVGRLRRRAREEERIAEQRRSKR
jgi:bifunctional DNA-binding transcriptional regulator/antitoxin component of YhaV-PrlF toxin-antitoxin module